MFQCPLCGGHTFRLTLRPELAQTLTLETNEHDEVVVQVGDVTFIADISFMNRFATCDCGATGRWAYYFPQVDTDPPVLEMDDGESPP